jgi:hypothetical protein
LDPRCRVVSCEPKKLSQIEACLCVGDRAPDAKRVLRVRSIAVIASRRMLRLSQNARKARVIRIATSGLSADV